MKTMKKIAGQLGSLFRPIHRRSRDRESFGELFDRFREVLDKNNRSLEIITDMGDTLGGDYLFDIQYIKKSYADLHAAMDDSLRSFNDLTQDRYPRLREAYLAIDDRIGHVIEQTVPLSKDLVIFYEDVAVDMVKDVGGKNCHLAEVRNSLKLSVPDAFAVTTRAFDAFMNYNRIFEKAQSSKDDAPVPGAILHELREMVLHGEMPPDLKRALEKAVKRIKAQCGNTCFVAIRSSAGEEDGEFSFAGQFETVLNVPLEPAAIEKAYKKVIASLFSEKSSAYQQRLGYNLRDMKMAAGCMVMVDAAASGVLYTTSPQGDRNTLIINATWGLGVSIVEGQTDADFYTVSKNDNGHIVETKIGAKDSMIIGQEPGGVIAVATPDGEKTHSSLAPEQVEQLARLAGVIEKHFRRPQDIEWAIDRQGKIFILQSRPLRVPEETARDAFAVANTPASRVLMRHKGLAVQKGVVAGRVFIFKNAHELESIPKGAILVARHDSSQFIRVMTEVSAIITDTGSPTSHMAALCREFKIPTAVNTGNATRMLDSGQEITVHVDDEGATLYQGSVRQLVVRAETDSMRMEELSEFRTKRYLLRYIAPLNLVDPLRDDFTPNACKTLHDILRFIHEKSVVELIESAGYGVKSPAAVKLDLPIPAGIMLIDIGGGLRDPANGTHVSLDQVVSQPFKAIITGMVHPGIWRSDAVPLKAHDFMTSMLRAPSIDADSASHVGANMAVISQEYVNLSLRFGYHFIVLDCYCGEDTRNNHIYFRFTGGATDMTKRSRRLQLIALILGSYGFNIKTKGDLIVARLANIRREEAKSVLDRLGRLISYTRQLDAVLNDDDAVKRYAGYFIDEIYQFHQRNA